MKKSVGRWRVVGEEGAGGGGCELGVWGDTRSWQVPVLGSGGHHPPSSCHSRPRVSAKGVSAARDLVSLPFRIFLGVWDHLIDAALWQCYCWVHDDFSLLYVLCKCNKSIARWISAPCMLWPGRRLIYQLLFRYLSFAIVTAGDNTTSPPRPASRGKSRSKI